MRRKSRRPASSPRHLVIRQVHIGDAHGGLCRLNVRLGFRGQDNKAAHTLFLSPSAWLYTMRAELWLALHESAGAARDRARRLMVFQTGREWRVNVLSQKANK
jgi:hypothetical protein